MIHCPIAPRVIVFFKQGAIFAMRVGDKRKPFLAVDILEDALVVLAVVTPLLGAYGKTMPVSTRDLIANNEQCLAMPSFPAFCSRPQ